MPRQFRDVGTGDNRDLTVAVGNGGYYAIVYRQPARQGGRWSWQVDRGSELIASGWVDTLTQARAAVEAALDAVGA